MSRLKGMFVPAPHSRYSPFEWHLVNKAHYRNADNQQTLADRVVAESERVVDDTYDITKVTKECVDHRFRQRVEDIDHNKRELNKKNEELEREADALSSFQTRLEGALKACEDPLAITKKCLLLREGRQGIDLVRDDVEKELLKEIDVGEGVQSLHLRTIERTLEQLRQLRSARYFVLRDVNDKEVARGIDSHCLAMSVESPNMGIFSDGSKIDISHVSMDEWIEFSRKNVDKATRELNNSRDLRSVIDGILKQTYEDLQRQKDLTDRAFQRRLSEYLETKKKLESEHAEVMKKINEMQMNIERLEKAVADKEGYLALAHSRLGLRTKRPNVEQCRDEVQTSLLSEVSQIEDSMEQLMEMLKEARSTLKYLLHVQLQLEEDINVKNNSILIDEAQCITARHSIQFHSY